MSQEFQSNRKALDDSSPNGANQAFRLSQSNTADLIKIADQLYQGGVRSNSGLEWIAMSYARLGLCERAIGSLLASFDNYTPAANAALLVMRELKDRITPERFNEVADQLFKQAHTRSIDIKHISIVVIKVLVEKERYLEADQIINKIENPVLKEQLQIAMAGILFQHGKKDESLEILIKLAEQSESANATRPSYVDSAGAFLAVSSFHARDDLYEKWCKGSVPSPENSLSKALILCRALYSLYDPVQIKPELESATELNVFNRILNLFETVDDAETLSALISVINFGLSISESYRTAARDSIEQIEQRYKQCNGQHTFKSTSLSTRALMLAYILRDEGHIATWKKRYLIEQSSLIELDDDAMELRESTNVGEFDQDDTDDRANLPATWLHRHLLQVIYASDHRQDALALTLELEYLPAKHLILAQLQRSLPTVDRPRIQQEALLEFNLAAFLGAPAFKWNEFQLIELRYLIELITPKSYLPEQDENKVKRIVLEAYEMLKTGKYFNEARVYDAILLGAAQFGFAEEVWYGLEDGIDNDENLEQFTAEPGSFELTDSFVDLEDESEQQEIDPASIFDSKLKIIAILSSKGELDLALSLMKTLEISQQREAIDVCMDVLITAGKQEELERLKDSIDSSQDELALKKLELEIHSAHLIIGDDTSEEALLRYAEKLLALSRMSEYAGRLSYAKLCIEFQQNIISKFLS